MGNEGVSEKRQKRRDSWARTINSCEAHRDTFQLELDRIKGLTARQLVDEGRLKYSVELKLTNGRTWLVRKVSYLMYAALKKGTLTARAARNMQALDDPRVIAELKLEDDMATAKKVTVGKTIKNTTEKKPRESASAMFQALLLAGELSDDKIFQKVQKKFGLDDKKRSYVAWYRNHLKKKGTPAPDPVVKGGKS